MSDFRGKSNAKFVGMLAARFFILLHFPIAAILKLRSGRLFPSEGIVIYAEPAGIRYSQILCRSEDNFKGGMI